MHRFWASPPEFLDLRRDLKSWQSIDAWVDAGVNIAGRTQPARVAASFISGDMLETLGVSPVRGRLIEPADDLPGAPRVADISYGAWQTLFGGDPGIVGHETQLDGTKCTIIGVMPRGFQFPPGDIPTPEVWSPLQIDPAQPGPRSSHFLYLLGRLKPGASEAQARDEMQSYVVAMGQAHKSMTEHYFNPEKHTLVTYGLQDEVVSSVRPALIMLLAAVGFVLLIACVNVANLLLARAEARRREIAIRSALGAGTGRLALQFVREGLLLSSVGALFGLAVAYGGLQVIKMTNAGSLPRAAEVGIDGRVLLFTVGATFLTGVLFGLAPILGLAYQNLQDSLKDTVGSITSAAGAQGFRRALVAGELAMALVLLIGCGLMVRGFWKLQQVRTGFNPDRVITMNVNLPRATYSKNEELAAFWTRMEGEITHLPGVQSAAIVSGLPPLRPPNMNDTKIENFVKVQGGPIENVDYYQVVSKDYFKTMGIRLMDGRLFDERDGKGAPDVVIVNETMARTFWGNKSPIGKRIQPGYGPPWCTIIGVVEDVKNAGLDKPAGTELYLPYAQTQAAGVRNAYFVLRAAADPRPLVSLVRSKLEAVDPTIPLARVQTMDAVLSEAESQPRFLTLLLTLFSGVALAIATVGIYGVISYSVARRSKEFGLRMALGAQPGNVLSLVMRQGFVLTAIGLALGVGAALGLTRLMATLLFGVQPTDPITFLTVSAMLAAVALAASYVPAVRATRVDPMKALRYE